MGDRVEGAWRGLSHQGFQLGEHLLDRIEIGGVFGKEQQTGPCGLDRLAHRLSFVRSEVVEHDDVVALEGRNEELFDVGQKALAVDGSVEQARRLDAVVAQSGEERRRLPVAVRDLGDEPSAALRPAVEAVMLVLVRSRR